jgi:hypothetical protein
LKSRSEEVLKDANPDYQAEGRRFRLRRGKAVAFRCRIEGNRWRHEGKPANGPTIEEAWERIGEGMGR